VNFEKFADEAHVRASGEFYFFDAVMKVEFGRECFGECLRAGVACVDERAVNVEQNEPNHAARKLNVVVLGSNAVPAHIQRFRLKLSLENFSSANAFARARKFSSGKKSSRSTEYFSDAADCMAFSQSARVIFTGDG
jgi:hypothetical protein